MLLKKNLFAIFFFSFVFTAAAQRTYTQAWKRIDSLIEKAGLTKTALKEVNAIYSSAKKEGNSVQSIKALVYRMQLIDQLSDSGRYENIAMIEKEIRAAREPSKSILHSIAGGMYWSYLQMNRWQLYQRSTTKGYDSKDISTWSPEQLYNTITSHFDQSISNAKILQELKLEKFEPIIIKGNVRYLRPTLFDLLAFRALDYYRNDERYVTRPAYAFEISDSAAFADVATFVRYRFKTNDSLSLHQRALEVYQQVLKFHINDAKHDALIDCDLDRLNFVRNFSTNADRDELYRNALEKLVEKINSGPAIADVLYNLANWHFEKGNHYDPVQDTAYRYSIVAAKDLCEKAIAMNAKNEGTVNCKNLLNTILRQEIRMKAEEVNSTGEPFRVLVQYRNVGNVYVRVVRYDRGVVGEDHWEDSFWKKVVALPVLKTYNYSLPATNDHQSHRVEIKIDSLPPGEYGILVSSDKNFALGKSATALQQVYVSNISYVNNGRKYYVLNRKTGAPLAGARIQVWEEYYNQSRQKQDIRKYASYTADANGYFEVNAANGDNARNIYLDILYANDRLFHFKRAEIYYYDNSGEKDGIQTQTMLFTDRSIYRPAQTIYFKGIVIRKDLKGRNSVVIPDHRSKLILNDANGQPVDSLEVLSNAFGSYSGKFIIPTGLLTGEFSISERETNSNTSFRVEEYKRPKFEVKISAPNGTYRVYDTINVEGIAVSFAGNNINGATVRYRVTRRAMSPFWVRDYSMRIWPPYPQQQMEIAHGNITTDVNGKFIIRFTAIPDTKVPKSSHPLFNYTITTDVTDLNGETRSGNATVSVGYEAMKMELDLPESLHVDSLSILSVRTMNMNDSFERADVKISIYKLNAPQKIYRERYWEQPDQFVMSRDEYDTNFPYDQYADELDKSKWKKEKVVITDLYTTTMAGNYKLSKKIPEPGWYVIEAFTKDRFGDSVITKKYVLLYNDKLVSPEARVMLTADRYSVEPGHTVKYLIHTNIDSAQGVLELLSNNNIKKDLIKINKTTVGSTITINESDRGGVVVKTVFVRNNRVYSDVLPIDVPFINKQLKIDYITYRDKTLPGSGEKWRVKISGSKGEKIAAELLTSMYDASLDQFVPHTWNFPALWTGSLNNNAWTGNTNFTLEPSVQREIYEQVEGSIKVYDRLLINDGTLVERQAFGTKLLARSASVAQDAAVEMQMAKMEESDTTQQIKRNAPSIQPRKNLNETAFFFPDLKTDADGNVEFSFTSPEALSTWNWMLLAHTKDLAWTYNTKKIITQKELMVQPNAPRFLLEGDNINFSVKVANMSTKTIDGTASLELFDPSTGKKVTGLIRNNKQNFTAPAGQSIPLSFNINVPANFSQPLSWKVTAASDGLSDGEEDIIPVLSNRMLVTETITLPVRNTTSKTFRFEKLVNSGSSRSLKNNTLTVEFTSNPAWYALQALPYLSEVKDENAEQVFNRFYANALASKLANAFPKLKSVIEKWKTADTSAFLSNLQKNQDLKNILLQETPWVLEAKSESQQKKNIALLFDMAQMSGELAGAFKKLVSMQSEDGSFAWYKNGPADRYITQYIVSGIGHLKKLEAIPSGSADELNLFTQKAIRYLDLAIKKDYDQIRKNNRKINGTYLAYDPIQYLYMRSFFTNIPVPANVTTAYHFFLNSVKQNWVKHNTYMRAMIALSLQRTGDGATAKKIIAALKESSIENDELGMYWKDVRGGYYWYQAPVETQSVLIEAFNEIGKNDEAVAGMKTWLLKNKQTNNWKTTKATADACYALLLDGGAWIEDDANVSIKLGETIVSSGMDEAGSGYFRKTFDAESIKPTMGNIIVNLQTKQTTRPSWGGVYWQYFEDIDKITPASTPLSINKKLFVQRNTDLGPVIEALDNNNTLHVGDRVKVRIEIRSDRNMEYVHLKDMRSSAMEPLNVLSEYKWQDGLGYFESTRDASTNFFFSFLQKGTYVFEYDVFVTHTGKFSNGVATIQCMYAPEFSSHSEGINVNVVE